MRGQAHMSTDLSKLPDAELDKLAAEAMGWTNVVINSTRGLGYHGVWGRCPVRLGAELDRYEIPSPTADLNAAVELAEWFIARSRGADKYEMHGQAGLVASAGVYGRGFCVGHSNVPGRKLAYQLTRAVLAALQTEAE